MINIWQSTTDDQYLTRCTLLKAIDLWVKGKVSQGGRVQSLSKFPKVSQVGRVHAMKPVQHSEYDYYWIPAKRFVLCLLWKDLALQKWIWKMKWKLDFFHWWDEGENGWFVVIYSSPRAEVNLNSPALLVSVLLVKWSVWIVLKWFIRRLVSTLLSWSLLKNFTLKHYLKPFLVSFYPDAKAIDPPG